MRTRHRLLWVLVAASLAGAALTAIASVALIRDAVRDRFSDRVASETALLASWIEANPLLEPQRFAVQTAGDLGSRVTLIAEDGEVLGDSSRNAASLAEMDDHSGRPEILAAGTRGRAQSVRTSSTTNVEYLYSAQRVAGDGRVRFVRVALPMTEVRRIQGRYGMLVAGMVPLAMLVLSAIGYAAVRGLSKPIEDMAVTVERAAGGELELELPRRGGREIERLGGAVNSMRQAMIEKLTELEAERTLLSHVIEGMREGLLLVGPDRQVRLVNSSLKRTLELEFDPEGHPLTEVIRHPTVIRDIESCLDRGVEVRESILRLPSGHSFQLRATPFGDSQGEPGPGGAIVLFLDISRLERLESIRREFVANVSHELRTPLTSIKAFVETLLDGGLDDRERAGEFLGIIRKHADRMGELIEDLTDLSLIETGAIQMELQTIDAGEAVRSVIANLEPLADRAGIRLDCEIEGAFPIRADRRRLEQMLTNLIDNAVKFSATGATVRLRGRRERAVSAIEVVDEGIGIPLDSLEKVFHRFYQEQRDETRERRGTGLGLSIVKHLMRLHGGRVRAESELGQGSTFILEFPNAD